MINIDFQFKEGIIWISFISIYFIWTTLSQIPKIYNSTKNINILNNAYTFCIIIIFTCFNIVLSINLKIILSIVLGFSLLYYFPRLISKDWAGIRYGRPDKITVILSFFLMGLLHIILFILRNNFLWLISSTILFTGGLINIYNELIVKKVIEKTEPNLNISYLNSGLTLKEEYPATLLTCLLCLLYFPILYFYPNISNMLYYLIVGSKDWLPDFLAIYSTLVIGSFGVLFISRKSAEDKILKNIIITLFMKYLLLIICFGISVYIGVTLIKNGFLNIEKGFLVFSDQNNNINESHFKLIIMNIWFAANSVLFINILTLGFVIIPLVLRERI